MEAWDGISEGCAAPELDFRDLHLTGICCAEMVLLNLCTLGPELRGARNIRLDDVLPALCREVGLGVQARCSVVHLRQVPINPSQTDAAAVLLPACLPARLMQVGQLRTVSKDAKDQLATNMVKMDLLQKQVAQYKAKVGWAGPWAGVGTWLGAG